jgi:DNA polymerase-3 subunit epsilon
MKSVPTGRFVVLDFETTGLSPQGGARVIEVSAREVVDGRAGEEFLTFVDPGQAVPSVITQITGITTEMLQGAPKSPGVMRELAAFIGSSPVVGHNVGFDRKFLEYEADEFLEQERFARSAPCFWRGGCFQVTRATGSVGSLKRSGSAPPSGSTEPALTPG